MKSSWRVIVISISALLLNACGIVQSNCEKIKTQLNLEEQIGFENWKIYDSQRDSLVENKTKINLSTYRYSANLVKPVVQSDKKIISLIDSNVECFSPAFVASVRNREVGIEKNTAQLNYLNISLAGALSTDIIPGAYQYLEGFYPNYYSWEKQLKLDR